MNWVKISLILGSTILISGVIWAGIKSVSRSVWDGKSQLILAVAGGENVSLWQRRAENEGWRAWQIPADILLPISQGYGSYKVSSLVGLDSLEKKQGKLVKVGLQEALGVVVDGYWIGGRGKMGRLSMLMGKFTGTTKTNLSFWDVLRLVVKWGRVEEKTVEDVIKIKTIDQPDGSKVRQVTETEWDRFVRQWLVDEQMIYEGMKIVIVNGTSHRGLGKRVERLVTNSGGLVVRLADGDKIQVSEIWLKRKDAGGVSVNKLKRFMEVSNFKPLATDDYRADLVVLIGENYWLKVLE